MMLQLEQTVSAFALHLVVLLHFYV